MILIHRHPKKPCMVHGPNCSHMTQKQKEQNELHEMIMKEVQATIDEKHG